MPTSLASVAHDSEPFEQVGAVDATVGEERLGLDDRHLGVVGELARRPPEAAAADHLADAADDRLGEPGRVLPGRSELERRTERVADGGADHGTERPLIEVSIAHRRPAFRVDVDVV